MDPEVEQLEVVPVPEDDRSVYPQTSITVETSPLPQSQTPEIYYIPDGGILPPSLIAIEEKSEEETSSKTPTHFGPGLYLYPSYPQLTTPFGHVYFQTPIDSLGQLLGHSTMAKTTSQTVSSITDTTESIVAISSMFTTTPESHLYVGLFIPLCYKSLSRTHSSVSSSPWSSPMSYTRILPGSSLTDIEQFDPSSQYEAGPSGYCPMYPLYTGLPPYGEKYSQIAYPPFYGGHHMAEYHHL